MFVFLHMIFWTMKQVYRLYQNKLSLDAEQGIDENYFERSKVTYNNAIGDAETGLKFDPPVYLQRYSAVQNILLNEKWREKIVKVVDFGCAELKFFMYLKNLINVQEVLLVDIDELLLRNNSCRVQPFNADYLLRRSKPLHVEVIQGSIDSPDPKLISVDAVICIEIIEHLYPDTLDALPHNIFHFIQPRIALFTTPNADFNELFPNFSGIRHDDHKFEWSRQQFEDWAHNVVVRYPKYSVCFVGIGPGPKGKEHLGNCSQMAVFIRKVIEEDETRKNLVKSVRQIESLPINLTLKDCVGDSFDLSEFLSHGVCTYQSYVANLLPSSRYNVICRVDHPHEIDNRTEEEIILHETEYRLHRLASSRKYMDYKSEAAHVPLYDLTSNRNGEFISAAELRTILQKGGWKIEEFDIDGAQTPCVIYENSSSSSASSLHSPSPNLNFSTEANWDSGSQWDLESTDNWDETIPNMETNLTESSKEFLDTWEDVSSKEIANTRINDPFESCLEEDSPISDPCVSGEQMGHGNEKVELLFDSGYQVSTSSIELSPDLSKDWLSDDKKDNKSDSENIRSSKSEKQCKSNEDCYPSVMKSEGHIFKSRKRNKLKVDEPPPNPNRAVVIPPIPAAAEELENPEDFQVVENGDLANNNRDLEGNNYQAANPAENHLVQIDDNALPRPENLDEHNENHIVLEQNDLEQNPDYQDDEDAAESLEDASREALFDSNSELRLSDDAFVVRGRTTMSFNDYSIPVIERFPQQPRASSEETFRAAMGFPLWLLQMLNINREETLDLEDDGAHFYSQGDGVGVHPSTTEVSDDTSSSSSNTTAERQLIDPNTTAVQSADSSITESTYEDALDDEVNPSTSADTPERNVRGAATDDNRSSSSDTSQ